MKYIKGYRGYKIKEITKRDISAAISEDNIGEYAVFDRDDQIEYENIETIEMCKELIDGLIQDKLDEAEHHDR